jgi:hypothetical protein
VAGGRRNNREPASQRSFSAPVLASFPGCPRPLPASPRSTTPGSTSVGATKKQEVRPSTGEKSMRQGSLHQAGAPEQAAAPTSTHGCPDLSVALTNSQTMLVAWTSPSVGIVMIGEEICRIFPVRRSKVEMCTSSNLIQSVPVQDPHP